LRVGSSTEGLSDELVVCTLDRPDEVVRCLDSVARQTRLPTSVRVVDASTDGATRTAVESYGVETVRERLVYQHAERGLTRQRNAGVRSRHSDIVHFVDDDCVLDPHHLEAIVSLFEADEPGELLGVGGMIVNLSHGPAPLTKRLLMLDGDRPGHVLPSGRNQPTVALASPVDSDWLSGRAMSLRREVFGVQVFDERCGRDRGDVPGVRDEVLAVGGHLETADRAAMMHLQGGVKGRDNQSCSRHWKSYLRLTASFETRTVTDVQPS